MTVHSFAAILAIILFPLTLISYHPEPLSFDNVFIGPEIYDVKRTKEGGVEQSGILYGFRLGLDHIKSRRFYWGADLLWASGTLEGKSNEAKIKSQLTDANIELRLGYTFETQLWKPVLLTPFFGVGYFQEKNFYRHPTPLTIHFDNQFTYVPFGFFSQIFFTPHFSAGVNIKVRYLLEGDQKVSNDPEHDSVIQYYNEKFQYRIELPLTSFFCLGTTETALSLVPFYEYREYGHRANFPFDFFATTFRLYGATLKLCYLF